MSFNRQPEAPSEEKMNFPDFVAEFCRIYKQKNDRSLWLKSMSEINQLETSTITNEDRDKKIFRNFQFLYAYYLLNQPPQIQPEHSKSNSALRAELTPESDPDALKFIETWQNDHQRHQALMKEINSLTSRIEIDRETLSEQDAHDLKVRIASTRTYLPKLFPISNDVPGFYAALRTEQDNVVKAFIILYKTLCAGCNRDPKKLLNMINSHAHTEKSLFDLLNKENDKGIAKEAFKLAQEHYMKLNPTNNCVLVTRLYQKAFACSRNLKRSKVISPFTFYRSTQLDSNLNEKNIDPNMIEKRLQAKNQHTRLGKMLKVMVDSQQPQPEQGQTKNRKSNRFC